MRYLEKNKQEKAFGFILKSAEIAKQATCERSKCGSVIVKNDKTIGTGYNTPPKDLEGQRRCFYSKNSYHKKVTDKTCCIHAEQRAIMDALQNNSDKLKGSRLYFVRLNENDEPIHAGNPYCTICSKMALDVGIAEFVLWHKKGVCVYKTDEYNDISYSYSN